MSTKAVQAVSLPLPQSQGTRGLLNYAAAVVLPVLTLLLRLAFWDRVPGLPFVTFIPSVALLAVTGGAGPAFVAAVLSAWLGLAYLAEPSAWGPGSQAIWIGFIVYSAVCAILIASTRQNARNLARTLRLEADRAAARESALQARLEAAEAAAARSRIERRLEQVTDALPVLISQVGRDARYEFVNRAYEEWFGRSREELVGRHLEEVMGPEVFARARPHVEAVLSGQATSFEAQVARADGEARDVRAHFVPNIGPTGGVEGYFALVQDVTEAKQQADLLARRERHLRVVLDSVTDCFYAVDREWRITLFNRAAERYYGTAREEVLGRRLWEVFPAHLGSVFERQLQRVMDEQVPVTFEAQSVVFPDRFIEMRVSPKEGSGIAVSFSDITTRKRAEHHRELLIRELNHRVKNTLAVVQSLAAQSLRDPRVPQATRHAFEGRLMALATAHDLLTQESWEAAQIGTVIAVALRPFGAEHRLEVSGPDLRIKPQAAVSLTLALHELATNATKYGALSIETGRVSVRWAVLDEEPRRLELVWRERDGPRVVPPTRRGFGSRLIRQGLAAEVDGTVTLDYLPEGVVCTLRVPVANLEPG